MEKAQIKKVINSIINANDAASLVEKEVSQSSFKSENIILIAIGIVNIKQIGVVKSKLIRKANLLK